MKRNKAFLFFGLFLCFISSFALQAQSSSTTAAANTTSTQFDMTGFPLWAKDLRRGEIIAFGAFPFAYLVANFSFDSYRFATNDWDRRYAPKPFNAAGTIEKTQSQKITTLWIAAGGAVTIALVDYGIMRYKRSREERELRSLPEGTPIINRRPLWEDEDDTSNGGD
jgi:hypothetical protein